MLKNYQQFLCTNLKLSNKTYKDSGQLVERNGAGSARRSRLVARRSCLVARRSCLVARRDGGVARRGSGGARRDSGGALRDGGVRAPRGVSGARWPESFASRLHGISGQGTRRAERFLVARRCWLGSAFLKVDKANRHHCWAWHTRAMLHFYRAVVFSRNILLLNKQLSLMDNI